MSFTVNVNTIGATTVSGESTSQAVYDAYNTNLQQMVTAATNILNNANTADQDIQNFVHGLVNLKNITVNGLSDSNGNTFYLTAPMASNLSTVFSLLGSFGISGDPSMLNLTLNQRTELGNILKTLPGLGVDPLQFLTAAQSISPASIHSLQSMIELEYVKKGNDLISGHLSGLETALSATSQILSTLALIQNISNNITVEAPGNFNFPPTGTDPIPVAVMSALAHTTFQKIPSGDEGIFTAAYLLYNGSPGLNLPANPTAAYSAINAQIALITDHDYINDNKAITANYEQLYRIFASAHFTQLYPTVPSAAITMENVYALRSAKSALLAQVGILDTANPNQSHTVPGTLSYYINSVASTITSYIPDPPNHQDAIYLKSQLVKWILDNQEKQANTSISGQVGNIQNGISQAITSAQFLNDQQKKDVQKYTFIFQQFYQSASMVLQGVTSIIQGMAQNISTH